MKILVTGASGFIGSQITDQLVAAGHEVIAPVLPSDNLFRLEKSLGAIKPAVIDLFQADSETLKTVCDSVELCVHTAWSGTQGKGLSSEQNVDSLGASIKLFSQLGKSGCKRLVALGSCFEYRFGHELLSEESPLAPDSLYAASKTAAFFLGREISKQYGMTFAWPRPFYLYGPREEKSRLIADVIISLLQNKPVELTEGTQVRDYLCVEDVASAIIAIAFSSASDAVNIGSGVPVTVRKLVSTVAEILSRKDLLLFGKRPTNITDPPFVCADTRKLREEIGWSPANSLEQGLRKTIEWWRNEISAGLKK